MSFYEGFCVWMMIGVALSILLYTGYKLSSNDDGVRIQAERLMDMFNRCQYPTTKAVIAFLIIMLWPYVLYSAIFE